MSSPVARPCRKEMLFNRSLFSIGSPHARARESRRDTVRYMLGAEGGLEPLLAMILNDFFTPFAPFVHQYPARLL